MDLLPVVPNPRFGRPPSWTISNDHISGMGYRYPIHLHELQTTEQLWRNIGENNERGVIRLVTI